MAVRLMLEQVNDLNTQMCLMMMILLHNEYNKISGCHAFRFNLKLGKQF